MISTPFAVTSALLEPMKLKKNKHPKRNNSIFFIVSPNLHVNYINKQAKKLVHFTLVTKNHLEITSFDFH